MTAGGNEVPVLNGIGDIAETYDGFILDLWGVLHDGVRAFPAAIEALRALQARGKRTCLLSNAPRRASATREQVQQFGLEPDLYDHVYTSGEAGYALLRDRPDSFAQALGQRLLHIGPDRDRSVFEGLGYGEAATPEEADFVLNTGPIDRDDPVEAYEGQLDRALARHLPMICANPDRVVHVGDHLITCAGALAQRYAEAGGRVRWLGKPYREVYDRALTLLRADGAERIAAIGDSLSTDIGGAHAAGLPGFFIPGGIHRDELGLTAGQAMPGPAELENLYRRYAIRPDAALAAFGW